MKCVKEAMRVNRNVIATINHNAYKDVLMNKKYLRHLLNIIQSKNHKIGTCEINNKMFSHALMIKQIF